MKFSFIFPGQGSKYFNTLKLFNKNSVIKEILEEASDALNQDLKKLIFYGTQEQLNIPENIQPIILTISYIIYKIWIKEGGYVPSIIAGHSLGEYTALVVAKSIQFYDALKIIRFRAKIIESIIPKDIGGMAAILGLNYNLVKKICNKVKKFGIVEIANFNAPNQIVITGHKNAIKKACEFAKNIGAKKYFILPISSPFHSSLLTPAKTSFKKYLSKILINKPNIPIISSVSGNIIKQDTNTILSILVNQLTSPVYWVKCINNILNKDIKYIIECGTGKILTNLVKQINSDICILNISDQNSLNKALKFINS